MQNDVCSPSARGIDLRLTLRYLGVPVYRSVMFGDNESVVTSGSIPHSQLNKHWTALSCHRAREAIAAQVMDFWHVPGTENPADMLSKHWACNKVSHVLRPILDFERGGCWRTRVTHDRCTVFSDERMPDLGGS